MHLRGLYCLPQRDICCRAERTQSNYWPQAGAIRDVGFVTEAAFKSVVRIWRARVLRGL